MEKDIRVPALYNQLWGNSQSPHLYYTSYVVLHYTSNFFLNWVKKYFDEIWVYLCLCNYMNIHVSVWSFKSLILFNKEVNLNVILCQFLYKLVVVHWLSCVWLFETPWTAAFQAFLSFIISQSFLKLMSIGSVRSSNHLVLCCPLLLLPTIFLNNKVFYSELALCIRWP